VESDPMLGRQVRRLPDGSCELTFHCPPGELGYYARFFAGLGPEVTVLAPETLRQGLLELGQKLVESYKK
jgi:predicted DNA-binding transcriptional regulator YafY